jgi:aspartate ammonia-lyase
MENKYTGVQTRKAQQNFPFSGSRVHRELIYAITLIKKAAATANFSAGFLDCDRKDAITAACDEIIAGKFDQEFSLPGLQGGAGTSINMNVNEAVAIRASEILKEKQIDKPVHPLDHVNLAQSTNDVNPSALKIVVLQSGGQLLHSLSHIADIFAGKSEEWGQIKKLGRTHLQDAVPVTLGEEFAAYAEVFRRATERIKTAIGFCRELNLGGTAVGNAINAPKSYRDAVYPELSRLTGLDLKPAANLMAETGSQTDFLAVSQALVILTLDASKIASDIRIMSSGPKGGFGELKLAELQSGSSIMPGKVNPILPESVNQLFYLVSGNNLTIEHAAHAAQLELGVMFPIFADNLVTSLKLTEEVLLNFADNCVATITVNEARCRELLEHSTAYATLLTPKLGYDTVSRVVKESLSSGRSLREIITGENLLTDAEFDQVIKWGE